MLKLFKAEWILIGCQDFYCLYGCQDYCLCSHEALFTQKSLSNQAVFSVQQIRVTNLNMSKICIWNFFDLVQNSQIAQIPIEMNGYCPQDFAKQQ